jgi:hypothetical protein
MIINQILDFLATVFSSDWFDNAHNQFMAWLDGLLGLTPGTADATADDECNKCFQGTAAQLGSLCHTLCES